MSLLDKLFSAKAKTKFVLADEPSVVFGRYNARNKNDAQFGYWKKSAALYNEKKYLAAYEYFFLYLKDENIDNVFFKRKNNRIEFEFVQGSKIIKGLVNDQEIYAEAEVVRFEEISSPVMAKLLRENMHLKFSKFVIKNNIYSIKYYSPVVDASPKSLYFALKELAIKADLFDDELINEFYTVKAINTMHIKDIPLEEKLLKLKYLRIWLSNILEKISEPATYWQKGEIPYHLLNFLYSVHYLIAPEGTLLADILAIESLALNGKKIFEKEQQGQIIKKLKKIGEKSNDELFNSLYKADATFSVNPATDFEQVKQFIIEQLKNINMGEDINETDKALEICTFILSYSSFYFGMPAVADDFLQIVWRVIYSDYFKELGFTNEYFLAETNSFNIELIKARIYALLHNSKKQHPDLKFNVNNLQFSDKLQFTISFFKVFSDFKFNVTNQSN